MGRCRSLLISSGIPVPTRVTGPIIRQFMLGNRGAVAAPTAGLHFTPDLMDALDKVGIGRVTLTLHIGAGTFLPVKVEDTRDHRMHVERGTIGIEAVERINATRAAGRADCRGRNYVNASLGDGCS